MRHLNAIFAEKPTAARGAVAAACVLTAALVCAPGVAKAQFDPASMTPAASIIENVAALTFTDQYGRQALNSNKVALKVQEIVDVSVETLTPELDVEANANDQRLAFRIRNLGNGREAFDLSFEHIDDDFDPEACRIIVDWDGDGRLDMTKDRVSSTTPVLAPGESVVAWVSCHIPENARLGALGRIRLRAFPTALRNGATVSDMSKAGNGGVFMVFGPNLRGGTAGTNGGVTSPPATYRVGEVVAQLIKSQQIVDVLDNNTVVTGTIVTYTLEARVGTGGTARQAQITDVIPVGATYLANSLTLDGARLSDAEDGDAGRFTGGAIEVGLGDLAPQSSRTVTFKVRINATGKNQ
ncbi:DUF11 domain-containing protein [Caulobacter sp. RHG1]|uniref:DUF11 domain-containing protein n=1 Tax=Caulobacter sp. (strain RHG1) TaxID=2545762 RepID=UPI001554C948|nr:DUF11 domain-containing protein [Caulobacter sp. RHG1]NQE61240.1 hypothetical protein [Caulobacter sp. RHG1]